MHPPPLPDASLLPTLRAATAQAHARLEAAVDIERCLRDRERYAALLRTFLGFYRPLERALESIGGLEEAGYALAPRRKTPWLQADLEALGMSQADVAALPDCLTLPRLDGPACAPGCLYVLEGSTLGGRHITSLMRNSAVPAGARRFFAGYGPETGARWKEFIAWLEAEAEAGGAVIIAAAQETFADMERWLNERMPRA